MIEHILHLTGKIHPRPKYGIVSSLDQNNPIIISFLCFCLTFSQSGFSA
nr:4-14 CRISPR MLO11 [Cucumis sativus]